MLYFLINAKDAYSCTYICVNGVFIGSSGNYITFYNEIIIICEIEKRVFALALYQGRRYWLVHVS